MIEQKTKEKMMFLLGQIEAIAFPLMWTESTHTNQAYYDLVDSIKTQLESIMNDLWGYKRD